MGELVASIAHEVEPADRRRRDERERRMRLVGNGTAPSGRGSRRAHWIIEDANRAGAVIGRIRAMVEKNTHE